MEYKQLEQRVRMDVPTLADPVVRDLFHESDLFVRSFHGMSSFGLLSPFELIHILTLVTELISNVFILWTLTFGASHHWLLVLSLASTVLPLILPWMTRPRAYFDDIYSPQEARSAAKQEKMRALAHSDPYRPEVILFGLGPWILQTWANARKSMLGLESESLGPESSFISNILSTVNIGGILTAVQNVSFYPHLLPPSWPSEYLVSSRFLSFLSCKPPALPWARSLSTEAQFNASSFRLATSRILSRWRSRAFSCSVRLALPWKLNQNCSHLSKKL